MLCNNLEESLLQPACFFCWRW